MPRRRRTLRSSFDAPRSHAARGLRVALVLVDNAALRNEAWSEVCTARKRLAKATHDLHRHEEIDEPGFRAWLGATFPELVSAVRDLTQQLDAKARIVEMVEQESWLSRRSARAVWRQWQREAAEPAAARPSSHDRDDTPPSGAAAADDDPFAENDGIPWDDGPDRRAFDAIFEDFCVMNGIDPSDPAAQKMRNDAARRAGFDVGSRPGSPVVDDARAIYRRLVQHLHPDRGGTWTPRRARLWHQVQEAWEARDVDMLARLEAEWDITADNLGPASAIGRLRAALAELLAARRDPESKVRQYRKTPAWRFSLKPPNDQVAARLRRDLEAHREVLRHDLARFEAAIAKWERPAGTRRGRRRPRATAAAREFAFDF